MPQRTDWSTLAIAITVGIVFGIGAAFVGVAAGLPTAVIAGATGAIVAAIVPLIYRARGVRQSNP